jgi:hypothetical protein
LAFVERAMAVVRATPTAIQPQAVADEPALAA